MDFAVIKIFLIAIGFIVGILSTAFLTIYFLWSSLIIRAAMWVRRWKAGVVIKYATFKDYRFCYFCRGNPGPRPVMLMLHGFSLDKDMWLDAVELFPKDVHFICLDLPGHGGTTRLQGESYSVAAQVERLHQFVECTGLNQRPFHLVGHSLGALLAGVYAAQYPSEVCCLSLMSPSGLRYSTDNAFIKYLKELEKTMNIDKIPLIPLAVEGMDELLRLNIYKVPNYLPKQLQKGFIDIRKPHNAFFQKCFVDFTSEESRYSLHENMNKIKAPTQIIWGVHDQITDPSGGEILAAAIPNSQLHMLEKCGHVITIDRPRKSAKLLVEFHNSVCGKAENKKSI